MSLESIIFSPTIRHQNQKLCHPPQASNQALCGDGQQEIGISLLSTPKGCAIKKHPFLPPSSPSSVLASHTANATPRTFLAASMPAPSAHHTATRGKMSTALPWPVTRHHGIVSEDRSAEASRETGPRCRRGSEVPTGMQRDVQVLGRNDGSVRSESLLVSRSCAHAVSDQCRGLRFPHCTTLQS